MCGGGETGLGCRQGRAGQGVRGTLCSQRKPGERWAARSLGSEIGRWEGSTSRRLETREVRTLLRGLRTGAPTSSLCNRSDGLGRPEKEDCHRDRVFDGSQSGEAAARSVGLLSEF